MNPSISLHIRQSLFEGKEGTGVLRQEEEEGEGKEDEGAVCHRSHQ